MDEQLRRLQQKAMAGDENAALQYYYQQQRLGKKSGDFQPGSEVIQISHRRVSGPVLITPGGLREVSVNRFQGPLMVNSVDYDISATYFFDDALGWTPYSSSTIKHAAHHLERYRTDIPSWPSHSEDRDITFYLPRLDRRNGCFWCEDRGSSIDALEVRVRLQLVRRFAVMGETGPTYNGIVATHNALHLAIPEWVAGNRPPMVAAELNRLQIAKNKINTEIMELSEKLSLHNSQLARAVIEELHLENEQK